eukprot:CAMPEP_0182446372 /NCGR_PEP_ID=MMETSP1172-20130603/4158_1 /TAXON_ID=708627 /ORGANISM="Timspurckia oligopyrenoides, Strain CCMP3278" /LENGTH=310 /DNA_ID=CAMNT_0024642289 /DNA_START=234 /DNA_END=1166 /DNA_ORIENTATION=-
MPSSILDTPLNVKDPSAGGLGSKFVKKLGRGSERTSSQNGENDVLSVAKDLRSRIMTMYGMFLSEDGSSVNYAALKKSPEFEDYCEVAAHLSECDPSSMNRSEKLAFFLNVYNSLLIHAMAVVEKPPSSVLARLVFYSSAKYSIGGLIYSLNDIENGILRGNRKPPAPLSPKPFKKGDPRLRVVVPDPVDERIHFALNCGAKSCPPIRFFTTENVDITLANAAASFVRDESNVRIVESECVVELSSIFDWYRVDFCGSSGSDSALLQKIAQYLEGRDDRLSNELRSKLLKMPNAKVRFAAYDWSLNESEV